jgi:hypothetical protein
VIRTKTERYFVCYQLKLERLVNLITKYKIILIIKDKREMLKAGLMCEKVVSI